MAPWKTRERSGQEIFIHSHPEGNRPITSLLPLFSGARLADEHDFACGLPVGPACRLSEGLCECLNGMVQGQRNGAHVWKPWAGIRVVRRMEEARCHMTVVAKADTVDSVGEPVNTNLVIG